MNRQQQAHAQHRRTVLAEIQALRVQAERKRRNNWTTMSIPVDQVLRLADLVERALDPRASLAD